MPPDTLSLDGPARKFGTIIIRPNVGSPTFPIYGPHESTERRANCCRSINPCVQMIMRICVIGLGKLGAPLAAILANSGHDVVGVDSNIQVVDSLNAGRSPVQEPELADLIDRNRSRLRATSDVAAAIADTDVTFIVVPTPSTASGAFSDRFVLDAIAGIGRGHLATCSRSQDQSQEARQLPTET